MPTTPTQFSFEILLILEFITSKASFHETLCNLLFILTKGVSKRCFDKPSIAYLDLSDIHSSLILSLFLGNILKTFPSRLSILIFEPMASITSTDSVFVSSQGLATN